MESWIQTLSIIATIIATTFYYHREIKQDINAQTARTDAQMARIDQLYNMFIDLIKEVKK